MWTGRFEGLIVVALVCVSLTNGQLGTNFGLYDGRLVRLDDPLDGGHISHAARPAMGGVGVVPVGSLGVHGLGGHDTHAHHGAGAGSLLGSSVLGSGLGSTLGGHGLTGASHLRQCPGFHCTFNMVLPRCRFTPVMRSAFGGYCLGCTEDICDGVSRRVGPNQRRRRRRIRRRLCRQFGICTLATTRALGERGGGRRRRN